MEIKQSVVSVLVFVLGDYHKKFLCMHLICYYYYSQDLHFKTIIHCINVLTFFCIHLTEEDR